VKGKGIGIREYDLVEGLRRDVFKFVLCMSGRH
jgi:hypothetical protein